MIVITASGVIEFTSLTGAAIAAGGAIAGVVFWGVDEGTRIDGGSGCNGCWAVRNTGCVDARKPEFKLGWFALDKFAGGAEGVFREGPLGNNWFGGFRLICPKT